MGKRDGPLGDVQVVYLCELWRGQKPTDALSHLSALQSLDDQSFSQRWVFRQEGLQASLGGNEVRKLRADIAAANNLDRRTGSARADALIEALVPEAFA